MPENPKPPRTRRLLLRAVDGGHAPSEAGVVTGTRVEDGGSTTDGFAGTIVHPASDGGDGG